MKPIDVIAQGKACKWIDTVVLKDERQYAVAVLVNCKSGTVFTLEVSNLTVVDTNIITKKENHFL